MNRVINVPNVMCLASCIPILLFFTSLMVLVYALQNEFQQFLRFDYSFLSSAYAFVPFCQKILLFNYIILLFSYDWCCVFIFCFITSCKETHNFNGDGLCFLRVDYFFLSSAYTFVRFCEKIILFNYIFFLFSYHWYCMFIFCFIGSCKETQNFTGPGLCYAKRIPTIPKVWLLLSFICLCFPSFLWRMFIL